MGKVDDMRRLREAQHQQRQTPTPTRAAPAASVPGVAVAPASAAAAADADNLDPPALDLEADAGSCSVCGKVKAMNRGVVVDHQKGLGKRCPGSRKPPG